MLHELFTKFILNQSREYLDSEGDQKLYEVLQHVQKTGVPIECPGEQIIDLLGLALVVVANKPVVVVKTFTVTSVQVTRSSTLSHSIVYIELKFVYYSSSDRFHEVAKGTIRMYIYHVAKVIIKCYYYLSG